MTFWLSALLFVSGIGVGIRARIKALRKKKAARTRVVERPNSHYVAPGVQRMDDLERWERIEIDQLHPVNRDEVDRLLALARSNNFDAITETQRMFLDSMAARGRADR